MPWRRDTPPRRLLLLHRVRLRHRLCQHTEQSVVNGVEGSPHRGGHATFIHHHSNGNLRCGLARRKRWH